MVGLGVGGLGVGVGHPSHPGTGYGGALYEGWVGSIEPPPPPLTGLHIPLTTHISHDHTSHKQHIPSAAMVYVKLLQSSHNDPFNERSEVR